MQHISLTPFGRQSVTSGLLAARQRAETAPALPRIDKWSIFNDLRTARARFGLSDRDLAVLYALLTFLPAKVLEDDAALVVFPSNASLSDRAHGMAESTLRRHLAALVAAGLIWRQDSPNGKRYAARDASGALSLAFGFDLRPLLNRAAEIAAAAAEVTEAAETLRRSREALVLRLRDAAKLIAYGLESALPGNWDGLAARLLPLRAALRRKMDMETITRLLDQAGDILRALNRMVCVATEEMVGSAAHSGRHHTNSKPDSSDSEPCQEMAKAAADTPEPEPGPETEAEPVLPLYIVLKACPDLRLYSRTNLTSWRDLVATAAELRGMMGISASAWEEALHVMGPAPAAIAVSAMLQRIGSIQNPGGYLRALSARAASGGFSPGPMIMALLNRPTAVAA
ncbi:replication initiation protein RepC [Gemmobacter caeni]|uniref:Replication initiation protein RepC n=1 Tax=Gemmobacter caeni TaxID=589035 RepID=A0A2T6A9C4_9RHOB|nr:plasmid replication protein RepC [Gemmobacter caeni]PTX40390.1 replication initiation protein RepC [Gemmobacter caeni]TWI89905.1 replication initiation protein RepC [Gemmobacter caeni]